MDDLEKLKITLETIRNYNKSESVYIEDLEILIEADIKYLEDKDQGQ